MKFLYFIVGLFSEQSMCLCHCWCIQWTVYVPLSLLVYLVDSLCASFTINLYLSIVSLSLSTVEDR